VVGGRGGAAAREAAVGVAVMGWVGGAVDWAGVAVSEGVAAVVG